MNIVENKAMGIIYLRKIRDFKKEDELLLKKCNFLQRKRKAALKYQISVYDKVIRKNENNPTFVGVCLDSPDWLIEKIEKHF